MKLPEAFLEKMLKLLGRNEYEELLKALNGNRQYGLRVNTLKVGVGEFDRISPFRLEPVPWTHDGFYISGEDAPGKHPYYHAGLYYIQEPSAMLPGEVLDAQPGERILDLCAAPGGKSVQIAAAMKGEGLLVSNDINAERAKVLIKNIELYGVRNAIVLNETPERLAQNFKGYFDRILIDAPCSGEGMFRKDDTAARSWENFKCERCTQLQEPILHNADRMLKPGGTIVYSTCTFSPEEDEQMILKFMREHDGYELVDIPKVAGIEGGRLQWADAADAVGGGGTAWNTGAVNSGDAADTVGGGGTACDAGIPDTDGEELKRTARLWPHRVRGEGHFVAKLIKRGSVEERNSAEGSNSAEGKDFAGRLGTVEERNSTEGSNSAGGKEYAGRPGAVEERYSVEGKEEYTEKPGAAEKWRNVPEQVTPYENLPESFHTFVKENMSNFPKGVYFLRAHYLYQLPEAPQSLTGLKVVKFGWFLGTFEGNRFEPSHTMATAQEMSAFKRIANLSSGSREISSYLKGETLMLEGEKGMTVICVDGYTLGWAKQTGDMLKNLYPRGWRRLS